MWAEVLLLSRNLVPSLKGSEEDGLLHKIKDGLLVLLYKQSESYVTNLLFSTAEIWIDNG